MKIINAKDYMVKEEKYNAKREKSKNKSMKRFAKGFKKMMVKRTKDYSKVEITYETYEVVGAEQTLEYIKDNPYLGETFGKYVDAGWDIFVAIERTGSLLQYLKCMTYMFPTERLFDSDSYKKSETVKEMYQFDGEVKAWKQLK